jgi:hypothetical protein
MKIFVSGYDHFAFVSAIARGFEQLKDCHCDTFTHAYSPVRKMKTGPWFKRAWHGWKTRSINRELLKKVQIGSYEAVAFIEGGCILQETVAKIGAVSPVILWCLDSMRHLNLEPELLQMFARVFFTEPTDNRIFQDGYYMPIGFDNTIYRRLGGQQIKHELLWVGSAHEDRLPRLDAVARFAENAGHDFGAYGYFYSTKTREKEFRQRYPYLFRTIRKNARISPEEANRLYNSAKIAVNLHFLDPLSQGVNPRTLEAPGAGCLLLTDYKEEIGKMLDVDREVALFKDMGEFVEKADYLLSHENERQAMAKCAHDKVHAEHTFAARCREMLRIISA